MPIRVACALFAISLLAGGPSQVRPGVWVGAGSGTIPAPDAVYRVYMIGEMHGLADNPEFEAGWLEALHREAGVREVAIEEDAVYEPFARAYVEGASETLPAGLCLRSGILDALREFNRGRKGGERVRVHLVDIDSPAVAIHAHLASLRKRIPGGAAIRLPAASAISARGMAVVEALRGRARDPAMLRELRTVAHSIGALREGFEVGIGPGKGSPYLEDRETAVAANLLDVARGASGPVMAVYGADHVSKSPRGDGGPNRDQVWLPAALRLEQAGAKVYSVAMFPLSGRWRWRGREQTMLWSPRDAMLGDGIPLDRVAKEVPGARWVWVDPKRERLRLPTDDMSGLAVDAFLLPLRVSAMEDRCAAASIRPAR
ncbi:MAG: hypothetical protein R2762_25005 [Bryobacteraceae bacterium]